MEHHFILRFSKDFKDNINIYESKIERIDNDRIRFIYKDKTYPGISLQLPCVVESQKTLDSKQFYKVCDVSTLVVVYPDNNINNNINNDTNNDSINNSIYNFEEEKKLLQLSGLTPPMKYVKSRRFKKKSVKYQNLEMKVQEIFDRDRKASKVEIIIGEDNNNGTQDGIIEEGEDNSDEISNIAAEIELDIKKDEKEEEERPEIVEIKKQIEEQEKRVEDALNPILKTRFRNVLNELKKKLEEMTG